MKTKLIIDSRLKKNIEDIIKHDGDVYSLKLKDVIDVILV